MYRLGIVLGDGELGLFDHRLQSVLGQGEALGVAQAGQLGIVSGIHAQNGEFGAAAPDLGEQLVVACHEYLAAFQLADHLTEQPGAENDAALFGYRSGDHGGDAQFQVIAGEGEGTPSARIRMPSRAWRAVRVVTARDTLETAQRARPCRRKTSSQKPSFQYSSLKGIKEVPPPWDRPSTLSERTLVWEGTLRVDRLVFPEGHCRRQLIHHKNSGVYIYTGR